MAYTPGSADSYNQTDHTADAVREEARNDSTLEARRKVEAETAGLQDARFIGYAEVLEVYARRSDVEHLADRRARHLAANPGEQSFTREAGYNGNKEPRGGVEPQTSRTDGGAGTGWTDDYVDGTPANLPADWEEGDPIP